ncbi:MAG TPA: hypothetical protein VNN10_14950, partial [Dehalococcoidia bacterium]|nr:hypothetical protein [Dehalococcoidia bacterium]
MAEQPSRRRRPGERERLEARVRELEEALRRAEERLRAHAEALEQATEAFHVIESSLTYRVSARLRAAVDRHAPAGSLRGNLAAGLERGLRLLVVFGPRAFLAHLVKVWVWAPKLLRGAESRQGTARAAPEEGALRAALQGAFRRARDLQRARGWRALGAQVLRPGIWAPKLRASLAPKAG